MLLQAILVNSKGSNYKSVYISIDPFKSSYNGPMFKPAASIQIEKQIGFFAWKCATYKTTTLNRYCTTTKQDVIVGLNTMFANTLSIHLLLAIYILYTKRPETNTIKVDLVGKTQEKRSLCKSSYAAVENFEGWWLTSAKKMPSLIN